MANVPVNKKLYEALKARIKRRYSTWPSAYASAALVKEYKAAGGKYREMARGGLTKWFDEKWVDLSRPKPGGGYEPCGREEAKGSDYPKCVPASKAASMSASERASAIRRKRTAQGGKLRSSPTRVATFTDALRRRKIKY
jgi:hypothetical protein